MASLERIFVYPVKSLGGIERRKTKICDEGLLWDRKWMLADEDGKFITQRDFPILNQLKVEELENEFLVIDRESNFLLIPKNYGESEEKIVFKVIIWGAEFDAEIWEPYASQWLSAYLDKRVVLVRMIDKNRIKKTEHWPTAFPVNFSDGYPIHIVNINSVKKVSEWCDEEIFPTQFRPNFLIHDLEAFEEDKIKSFIINGQKFGIIKQCERCIMSTIKPDEGTINKQPLAALAKFRRDSNKVNFGIYAIPIPDNSQNYLDIEVNQKLEIEFT
ncbi:MAG: MOSC domain-containing protein [Saprospiraceae bacterium]|nr:MOSC domain-containing protein [Saprospiraceae bacterium]